MDSDKVAKCLLNIRKKHNLTQQQFGDMFGVTYQAVSKWETGKNIPDLLTLKKICHQFDINIDGILNNKSPRNNKSIVIMLLVVIILIIMLLLFLPKNNSYDFKVIKSEVDNFTVSGSVAYNCDKSSIYIARIDYAEKANKELFDKIECVLYESKSDHDIKISSQQTNEEVTIKQFLDGVSFNVPNYEAVCHENRTDIFYLQVNAYKGNQITNYKIPLDFTDDCECQD